MRTQIDIEAEMLRTIHNYRVCELGMIGPIMARLFALDRELEDSKRSILEETLAAREQ